MKRNSGETRLRVVPLSRNPPCVTRKKMVRKKWPREILGARSTRKEGLSPKPKSLNYALLSQRKNMIGLFYERGQHAVIIRDTCDILHAGMLSRSLKIKLCMQPEQIKALELCLTGRDVRTILPTGYGKS